MDPLLLNVPDEIVGKRVNLKSFDAPDAEAIHEAIEESRAELGKRFAWANTERPLDDRRMGLRRGYAARILRNEFGYGIWRNEDGHFLGEMGIYGPDWKVRRFELGYWLRSTERKKGYATEAAELLCDLCFNLFEARKVVIQCDGDNEASAGVPKRLGFEQEAFLKRHTLGVDGEPRDVLMFGMTNDMWRARMKKPSQ